MLFKIVFYKIIGYVNITVECFFIERFINTCINNKIFLWAIKRRNQTSFTANISISEFKKIRKIAKKFKCKIKINSKNGFPIILHRYRKRKVLAIIMLLIIIIIIFLSCFIWNIDIKGNTKINSAELLEQLEEEGIKIGRLKNQVDCNKVINNIRLKRDDISWMSIDMKGTNVVVKIVEAEEKPEIVDEEIICNVIANKRAMITKITANNGTANVKVGDIVEEGDVLIGGYIEGKYTGIRNVHANGEIKGKVWYTKKIESRIY